MIRNTFSKNEGFSLVETLVVIAIMSLLTVLAMSSFTSLGSTSLTASGNQMVDVFAMARQNSIAKNAYTGVAIRSQGTGAYSSYCLLELTRGDDGSLGKWTAISPWRSLGQGIFFDSTQTFISSPTTSLPEAVTPFPLPTQGSTPTVYQCYQPDGTLLGGQSSLRLRLIQGAGDPTSGTFIHKGTSYYDLVFVGNTGITKIERP